MNISTILFGIIVLFFLWRGYEKGFFGSITRLLGWLIAYPAAVLLTKPVSNMISNHSKLDGLIVYFIAGGSIFLLVSFVAAQLFKLLTGNHKEKNPHSARSRIGGALIGVCVGGFVGLLVGYAMLLVQKTAPASLQPNISTSSHADITHASSDNSATINGYTEKQQTVHRQSPPSLIETGAKKLVGKVAATAMDMTLDNPSATQITRDIAENPQETLAYIKQIADTGEFTSLLADAEIQDILEKQDTEALLENGKFQNLLATENMQGLLANMHNDSSGKTPEQLIADTMMQGWNRMDAMKKDPRVNAILADPEFREELNNGNNMRLLMNPKMKELTEILFNKPDAQAQDTQTQDTQTQDTDTTAENLSDNPGMADGINALQETLANESKAAASKPEIETEKPIYRWVDENGSVHFSDHEKGSDETRQ